MSDLNLPVLPPREERRRRSDRRSSDPAKRDRRRARSSTWTGPERRRGPRRVFDRRRQNVLRALLATLLCMFCLAAPPDLQADSESGCLKPGVTIEFYGRAREAKELSLALCDGAPNLAVLDEFSVHVRPRGARIPRPGATLRRNEQEGFVGRDIRRFDPRVLSRLQEVAERWPDKRIIVVSAYRPGARVGSRHHHAQAIDIRVEGVHRAEVAEFARALPETGVGFYPASTFTHIDVRIRPSFWVDESEPGQRSRYVSNDEEDAFFAAALAALPSRIAAAAAEAPASVLPVLVAEPAPAQPSVARTAGTASPVLRDVQRAVRDGLRGAFVVSPAATSPANIRVAVSTNAATSTATSDATGAAPRDDAATAPATSASPTPSTARPPAPTTQTPQGQTTQIRPSEPINWDAPW